MAHIFRFQLTNSHPPEWRSALYRGTEVARIVIQISQCLDWPCVTNHQRTDQSYYSLRTELVCDLHAHQFFIRIKQYQYEEEYEEEDDKMGTRRKFFLVKTKQSTD